MDDARSNAPRAASALTLPALCLAALLSACGGSQDAAQSTQAAPLASTTTTFELDTGELPPGDAQLMARPAFHLAPVLLDTPSDAGGAGGGSAVHAQAVPSLLRDLPSRRLTVQAIEDHHAQARRVGDAAPLASSTVVATYTPAQIRAAYGYSPLPAAGTPLTAAQAAQLGAGQTIYIVDAQ